MNKTIMVVDDEPAMLALIEIILKRRGFNVVTAAGGYQALALLTKEKPDLFILDMMMPGITGLELCKHLRNRPDTNQTPVIILSGWSDTEMVARGLAAGANAYLSKSTPHSDIVLKVQDLLGRPPNGGHLH